mmetsp:Transcript_40147/g.93268  ORF Transcript_40147/g.93268 Transcript_40147/m.93268 type:complete len:273 (-) Transcript_40147:110-928(-)
MRVFEAFNDATQFCIVDVVEHSISCQQEQVAFLDRKGVQLCIAGQILLEIFGPPHCLHQQLLAIRKESGKVRRFRHARKLEGLTEGVLLLLSLRYDLHAGTSRLPPELPQPRIPQIGHTHRCNGRVQCNNQRCGCAKCSGPGVAISHDPGSALPSGQRVIVHPHGFCSDFCALHELAGKGAGVQAEACSPLADAVGNTHCRPPGGDEEGIFTAIAHLLWVRDLARPAAEEELVSALLRVTLRGQRRDRELAELCCQTAATSARRSARIAPKA